MGCVVLSPIGAVENSAIIWLQISAMCYKNFICRSLEWPHYSGEAKPRSELCSHSTAASIKLYSTPLRAAIHSVYATSVLEKPVLGIFF